MSSPSASTSLLPPPPSYSPAAVVRDASLSPSLQASSSLPSPSSSSSSSDAMIAANPLEQLAPSSSGEPARESRHLPHLIRAALSLSLTKASIHLVLSEAVVYVSPPKVDQWGFDEHEDEGKDGTVSGFVNVVSPTRRFAAGIKLELIGRHHLTFPDTYWEEDKFMRKELVVGKEGMWLEKGVNTWEFCFSIPSSSPVSDYSRAPTSSGWTKYHLTASVIGSGSMLRSDLSDTKPVMVACKPNRETTILHVNQQSLSPHFGPFAFELASNEFLVGGGLTTSLTLADPPAALTIFAVNVYLVQTTGITSTKPPFRSAESKGTKQFIARQGEKDGYADSGFAERARRKGKVLFEGGKTKLKPGEMWTWEKFGRLPTDGQVRASTIPGTVSPFKFSSELVLEIVFNETHNPLVRIATLYRQMVNIASCCCMLPSLSLPNYGDEPSISDQIPKFKADGSYPCMCDQKFETLEADAIALMRNGGYQPDGEFLLTRRAGGSMEEILGSSSTLSEEGGLGLELGESEGRERGGGRRGRGEGGGCAVEIEEERLGAGMVRGADGRVRKVGEIC